jgi:lipoprotein NlpD
MKYLSVGLIAVSTFFMFGCTTSQAPARVATIKPNIKRVPPKVAKAPQLQSRDGNNRKIELKNKHSSTASNAVLTKNTDKPNQTLQWSWPAKGSILTKFSAGQSTFKGIDIGGAEGTPVYAASDGEVVYSGNSLRGYGNLIIIKHNKNFLTAYAHNRTNMVKEGEKVIIGQRIAEMGKTGTDKVKLHFEVRYQGKPIDPQEVLPAR